MYPKFKALLPFKLSILLYNFVNEGTKGTFLFTNSNFIFSKYFSSTNEFNKKLKK